MYHPGARRRKSAEDGYHDPPIIQYDASGFRVGARGVRAEVEPSEVEVAGVAEALAIATAAADPLDPLDHRPRDAPLPAAGPEGRRRVLAAQVGVTDHRLRPPVCHRHLRRIDHERGSKMPRHRAAHDPTVEHVEDDGQTQETCQGRDAGDAGCGRAWAFRGVVRGPRRVAPALPAGRISRTTRSRLTATPPAASSA